ncbi:complement component (3d Epstein Barr virus) receptor 2 [Chamberlinius hualienensis]
MNSLLVFLILLTVKYAGSHNDVAAICKPELIRCLCGNASDTMNYVTTAIISCLDRTSLSCKPCLTLDTSRICGKYEWCKSCGDGLDRCLNCPQRRYGQWCEKDCSCVNNGACDDKGNCICQHGYVGNRCEILVVTDVNSNFSNLTATDVTPTDDVTLTEDVTPTDDVTLHRVSRQLKPVTPFTQCPMIATPENGWAQTDTLDPKPGSVANYGCKDNFTMIGSRTRYCLPTGLWSGEAPTCERLCAYPAITPNLNAKINPNLATKPMYDSYSNEILSELEFHCDEGYVLIGAKLVRCVSGSWDNDIPTCGIQVYCQEPGEVIHGSKKVVGLFSVNRMYILGTQIIFNCDNGYVLIGKSTITCTPYGYWSSPLPVCVPSATTQCSFNCKSLSGSQSLQQPLQCKVASQNDVFMLIPDNS